MNRNDFRIDVVFIYREVQKMMTPNDQTSSPQYTSLLNLIESIRKKTNDLETIWGKRRIRVELFVQMKHFEIHSREVSVSCRRTNFVFLSTSMVIMTSRDVK